MYRKPNLSVEMVIDKAPKQEVVTIAFEKDHADGLGMAIMNLIAFYKAAPKPDNFKMSVEALTAIDITEQFLLNQHCKNVKISVKYLNQEPIEELKRDSLHVPTGEPITDGDGEIAGWTGHPPHHNG